MAKKNNQDVHTAMTPVSVIRDYVYQATTARVRIDFFKGEIHLLDNDFSAKKWVFANRSIEYMQGWKQILDAMKYAIDRATEEMEGYKKMMDERNDF